MEDKENRPNFSQWLYAHLLPPLIILVLGAYGITKLAEKMRPELEEASRMKIHPTVEAIEVQPQTTQAIVESQGIVEARTQTTLFAEVSGRIESISPALYAGGFFSKGDQLAKIDNTDYIANLAAAQSRHADALLAYEQEKAAGEQAQEDWEKMGNEEAPSALLLRKPQLTRALANLEATKANVKSAERDLQRTTVKAPYDGRVQSKFVDIGQFVNARSSQIASIYAVNTVEVRLGISLNDTRLITLPETYSDGTTNDEKPKVLLTATYGGIDYEWEGIIDRSEGTVDPQTRLLNLVAQVENPYSKKDDANRPPLKIGSFVRAKIMGERIERSFSIPRRALRENDSLFIVSPERTLEIRKIQPYQKTRDRVIILEGISAGEFVCLTPLQYVVNGMQVRLSSDPSPAKEKDAEQQSETKVSL